GAIQKPTIVVPSDRWNLALTKKFTATIDISLAIDNIPEADHKIELLPCEKLNGARQKFVLGVNVPDDSKAGQLPIHKEARQNGDSTLSVSPDAFVSRTRSPRLDSKRVASVASPFSCPPGCRRPR